MKRRYLSVFCAVFAVFMTCSLFLAGCFGSDNPPPADDTPKEYVIQYTDGSGTHKITVTDGMPYSLDVLPTKTGYEFIGLYDAEEGGTQYVSANGSSLMPFTEKKNLVLFPQFKAKQYTVILDYQSAPVTGERQLTVTYGDSLPELPSGLTGDNKEFVGWFTKAECAGTKIADKYGLIPLVSVLNEQNFDLGASSLTLYAGFEISKQTVTLYFETGMPSEEIKVDYGTPVSQIVPVTRVEGNAVLTWSKSRGGQPFSGNITTDMVLYALEYAPVINLDSNGGNAVKSVVARAGSSITLPTPTKDLAKFTYWEDADGNEFTLTSMPEKSITLKAVWQAKLVFDENGGLDVDDISKKTGEAITLPTPEREGFIFAGWYTADKEKYTAKTMPSNGIALKAGWYKEKTVKVEIGGNASNPGYSTWLDAGEKSTHTDWGGLMNLSDFLPSDGGLIKIKYTYAAKLQKAVGSRGSKMTFGKYFYDGTTVSDGYLVAKYTADVTSTEYKEFTFDVVLNLTCNEIFVRNFASCQSGYGNKVYFYNIVREMTFGDTTNLYL